MDDAEIRRRNTIAAIANLIAQDLEESPPQCDAPAAIAAPVPTHRHYPYDFYTNIFRYLPTNELHSHSTHDWPLAPHCHSELLRRPVVQHTVRVHKFRTEPALRHALAAWQAYVTHLTIRCCSHRAKRALPELIESALMFVGECRRLQQLQIEYNLGGIECGRLVFRPNFERIRRLAIWQCDNDDSDVDDSDDEDDDRDAENASAAMVASGRGIPVGKRRRNGRQNLDDADYYEYYEYHDDWQDSPYNRPQQIAALFGPCLGTASALERLRVHDQRLLQFVAVDRLADLEVRKAPDNDDGLGDGDGDIDIDDIVDDGGNIGDNVNNVAGRQPYLSAFTGSKTVSSLTVSSMFGVLNIGATIAALPNAESLRALHLIGVYELTDWDQLTSLVDLEELDAFLYKSTFENYLKGLSDRHRLRKVHLEVERFDFSRKRLAGLQRLVGLRTLEVSYGEQASGIDNIVRAMGEVPSLRTLRLYTNRWRAHHGRQMTGALCVACVPHVEELDVVLPWRELHRLAEMPRLRRLTVMVRPSGATRERNAANANRFLRAVFRENRINALRLVPEPASVYVFPPVASSVNWVDVDDAVLTELRGCTQLVTLVIKDLLRPTDVERMRAAALHVMDFRTG